MKLTQITILLLVFLLAACGAPARPEGIPGTPLPEFNQPLTEAASYELTQLVLPTLSPSGWELLARTQNTILYQFFTNQNNRLEGNFCLWSEAHGYVVVAPMTEQVASFANARISPDENTLVYAPYFHAENLAELWAVNVDGTNPRRLLTTEQFLEIGTGFARALPFQIEWIPGADLVIFNTSEFNYKGLHLDDLHAINLENGELDTVLGAGQGGFFDLSPDGASLAVVGPRRSAAYDVNSWKPLTEVTYQPVTGLSSDMVYPSIGWLPDSSAYFIAVPMAAESPDESALVFYRVYADGREAEQIITVETGFRPPTRPVFFSPDGEWAAFEAQYAETLVAEEIHLVKLDGSAHHIFTAEAYFHEWATDGQGVVFITPTGFQLGGFDGQVSSYIPVLPANPTGPSPWTQDCGA